MISYPGDILKRFGRYEGVENIDSRQQADLWKAWDPYLERFVLVVALPALDQAELYRTGPEVTALLSRSLGETLRPRRVLDFSPPSAHTAAFFVTELGA